MNAMMSGSSSVPVTAAEMATKRRAIRTSEATAEKLGEVLSVRVSESDLEALDELEKQLGKTHVPLKRITIARIALRLGIGELQKDRSRFFEPIEDNDGPRRPKPKRRRG